MAIIQEIKNGQLVENVTASGSKTESKTDLGYDQFLQILCAEMQYQDPLNPTSNTDYIAQMATFTQVESMLNMQNTMTSSQANDLVGKYVIMKVTSSTTGEVSYASGNVDYVLHQNGKTFLSIGDALYNIEDLDTVADNEYMEAVSLAKEFELAVKELPPKGEITLAYGSMIKVIAEGYNSLTEYQKNFISDDAIKAFTEKYSRYNELLKAQESASGNNNSNESTEGTNGTEGSEGTEGTNGTESSEGTTTNEGSENTGDTNSES